MEVKMAEGANVRVRFELEDQIYLVDGALSDSSDGSGDCDIVAAFRVDPDSEVITPINDPIKWAVSLTQEDQERLDSQLWSRYDAMMDEEYNDSFDDLLTSDLEYGHGIDGFDNNDDFLDGLDAFEDLDFGKR